MHKYIYITIALLLIIAGVGRGQDFKPGSSVENLTYFSSEKGDVEAALCFIIPETSENQKFLNEVVQWVGVRVYISGHFVKDIMLDRDPESNGVWRKKVMLKAYNYRQYKFRYFIATNQRTLFSERSRVVIWRGKKIIDYPLSRDYEYTFKTSPRGRIAKGSIGIGSFGYGSVIYRSGTNAFGYHPYTASLLDMNMDFGIGLRIGFNAVHWSLQNLFLETGSGQTAEANPKETPGQVHFISIPRVQLSYDFKLHKSQPMIKRVFQPLHFRLSPVLYWSPVQMVIFDKQPAELHFRYSRALECGIRLHSGLYYCEMVYTRRFRDHYQVNGNSFNLEDKGSIVCRFGWNLSWQGR